MLLYLRKNILTIEILAFWAIAGVIFSPSLYIIVPATAYYFSTQNKYQLLFFGFWFILILSDSRNAWSSAATVKIIYLLLMMFLYLTQKQSFKAISKFYQPFIFFFLTASISMMLSNDIPTAFQKTLSYLLLLIIAPVFIKKLLYDNKELFLFNLVWFGAFILAAGLVLKFATPDFVTLSERFTGMFGNPNGLGIYCILYTMLWLIIKYYYPHLFSKKQVWLVNMLILASLVFAASRGALFATFMFFAMERSVVKKNIFIMIAVIAAGIFFLFIDNLAEWLYSIGLGEYFRAQTIEQGGGRKVAYEFAWTQIKLNPIFGKGFGYTEYIFHRDDIEEMLNLLNHQGNTHNSYMTIIMDAGYVGLAGFLFGWLSNFAKAFKKTKFAIPVLAVIAVSTNVESWLAASLNPFTIMFIMILVFLTDDYFLNNETQAYSQAGASVSLVPKV